MEPDNLLLKGSSLRNTEYVYGVAVYTGHETKIMKNSIKARYKKSDIQKKMDKYILVLILMQTCICTAAGIINATWMNLTGQKIWYLNKVWPSYESHINIWALGAQGFGTWFLALMNFVPISLLVTLEFCQFF